MFHATGGLQEYVKWLNRDNTPLHEPIVFGKVVDSVRVEVSLQWCSDTFSDTMLGFVNSIRTVDGGTHLDGTKTALTRTVNALARKVRLCDYTTLFQMPVVASPVVGSNHNCTASA